MKKRKRAKNDRDMLAEYDFTAGQRGRYSRRFAAGSNVIVLDPDVAAVFTDSRLANNVLRAWIEELARQPVVRKTARKQSGR